VYGAYLGEMEQKTGDVIGAHEGAACEDDIDCAVRGGAHWGGRGGRDDDCMQGEGAS